MKRETRGELREWIENYRKYLLEIEEIEDGKVIETLELRDKIKNLMEKLEKKGVDLSAEKSRLDSLDQIIKEKAKIFWKKLKSSTGDPVFYRQEKNIPPKKWWWYPDEIIREEKRRFERKWIKRAIIAGACLGFVYLFFTYILPKPTPYISCIQEAERLLEEGKINPALETYQKAIKISPEEPVAYLMAGVICEFLGDKDRAKSYFIKAKERYPSLYDFYLARGMSWMRLGKFSAAEKDAKEAVKLNPQSAEAHFLLGNAYEAQNKIPEAITEFGIVSQLDTDPKLTVMARYKIGILSLKRALPPEPTQ